MKTNITKRELIEQIKEKTKKASPIVKRRLNSMLSYQTKAELQRMLKKARVVKGGDISFV